MAKDETSFIFLFITLLDVVYSIYLTGSSWTKFPGETIAVICRDEGGQLVMWRGPKGPLGSHTRPSVMETAAGKMLVFDDTRIGDTGNYSCSLQSDERQRKVFSLVVEEPDSPEFSQPEVITQITYSSNRPKGRQSSTNYQYRLHTKPPRTSTEESIPRSTENMRFSSYRPYYTTPTQYDDRQNRYYDRMKNGKEPMDFRDTPTMQRGVEGQDVALRCEVSGPSIISWIVPDGNLTNPKYKIIGDGLLVRNISREDTDQVYLCEASQRSTGELKRRNITLIVEHAPVPEEVADGTVYAQDDEIYGFIDETVNLTCAVRAEPPPTFEWYRKHKGGRGHKINSHKPILQLRMTENTEGEYQCVATNAHGKLDKTINLRIGRKPDRPVNLTLENSTADSLILNVELPDVTEEDFDEGMHPTWLVIQYRRTDSEEWRSLDVNVNITEDDLLPFDDPLTNSTTRVESFTLSGLEPKTKYEVIAATKNIASLSDFTEPAFFETSPSSSVRKELCFLVLFVNFLNIVMSRGA
ncbi:unnamed protein product [Phaedon cochleariae]|uniref:Uncharacterized protein n=1 Tax=Phaedon cochleariae TaxID=80249 RepID=A0A9P0DKZ3_PHACE|nr:unnamed protein product [Phaedon cochleariae]